MMRAQTWLRLAAAALAVAVLALIVLSAAKLFRVLARYREAPPLHRTSRVVVPGKAPPPETRTVVKAEPPKKVEPPSAPPIIPTPKVYRDSGRTAELLSAGAAAIVIGAKAAEPERYAAERLQGLIQRRFGQQLPICTEDEAKADARQLLLLGQRTTHAGLDRLCREKALDLSETSPGHDGFVLEVLEDNGRSVVLIGGSNPRGVVYGQDAFFDLLRWEGAAPAERRQDSRVVFPVVSVRDWPSIAWRGRPHSELRTHVQPGALDAYSRARLNFTGLRDGPTPRGQFGFAPGQPFDQEVVRQTVAEAHRRGIFVYGTVSCSHVGKEWSKAEATFSQLRDLGVDGFWIDFNDLGAPPDAPELVERLLSFARGLGIEGHKVASTPPIGAYEQVPSDYSRRMARVPGFAETLWLFTCVPGTESAAAARELGLKHPGWWHNWPRADGGFLHLAYAGLSLRTGGRPAYLEVLPLSVGWGRPTYESLRPAAEHTDTVMYWGNWPEEYYGGAFGIWAWCPEKHQWPLTRAAVYATVFGPAHAEAAQAFDDKLAGLKALFVLPGRTVRPGVDWPPRLKDLADRAKALRLLDEMDALLGRLEARAPADTLLAADRLKAAFLEPMRATVTIARLAATLDYPDYAQADLEARVGEQVAAGDIEAAKETLRDEGAKIMAQVDRIVAAFDGLEQLGGDKSLQAFWEQKISGLARPATGTPAERAALAKDFGQFFAGKPEVVPWGALARPPAGEALAELGVADWHAAPMTWNGPWGMGLLAAEGQQALGVAYHFWGGGETYHYIELTGELPVPKPAARLTLDLFVAQSPENERNRAMRFAQVWVGGKLLWEDDVAASRTGKEWLSLDVTKAAQGHERLQVRFRIVNRRRTDRFPTLTCLGPARLRAGEPGPDHIEGPPAPP